jgi:hypothetical protein
MRIVILIFFCLLTGLDTFTQNTVRPRKVYSLEQAVSDKAQLHTIAFNGLAYLTGNWGADCFFPPGKLADYFGFQYMRDNDKDEKGHSSAFLTNIAHQIIDILSPDQREQLIQLARQQAPLYDSFAYHRIAVTEGLRQYLASQKPEKKLNQKRLIDCYEELYALDGALSLNRARTLGNIILKLNEQQKKRLQMLPYDHSTDWEPIPEAIDKKQLTHREHVAVMTYASELFSWYKGTIDADVYFCPERHGTCFGGFYLKDFPAMAKHDYNISTSLTGDAGKQFIALLNAEQKRLLLILPEKQRLVMEQVVKDRTTICTELRKCMRGEAINVPVFNEAIQSYGQQDGTMTSLYAETFANLSKTLTEEQRRQMRTIRNQDLLPKGLYLFADEISLAHYRTIIKEQISFLE